MIGTYYDISRIDSHSVQFDDATTASFSLSGKLRQRSSNPDQDREANLAPLEECQREQLLTEISELLGRYLRHCAKPSHSQS